MTIHWKAVEQFFNFNQFVIFENLSILDLALSGVKGLLTSLNDGKLWANE